MAKTEGKIKLEHFYNLVAVAFADGYFDDDEKKFLFERAEDYGLPFEAVEKAIINADKLEFMVPMNQEGREEQLSDIVYMAMIDGDMHEKEYQLCLGIAKRLDLDESDLDSVIALSKKLN